MDDRTHADGDALALFPEESEHQPKRVKFDTESIDLLFADEDAPGPSAHAWSGQIDWQELNALRPRDNDVDRTAAGPVRPLAVVLIAAAALLGFAAVNTLLN